MATILIIDDAEDLRVILRHLLEGAGYRVLEAADGEDGLRVWRQGAVDLVITDLIMPRKDGFQVITEIRRELPGAKIMAISGAGDRGRTNPLGEATRLGAARGLHKPFDLQVVLQAVKDLLALDQEPPP